MELPGETLRVPLSKIRYIDVFHNYSTVHAGRDCMVKRSLGELEKELDGRFFRVGGSSTTRGSGFRCPGGSMRS